MSPQGPPAPPTPRSQDTAGSGASLLARGRAWLRGHERAVALWLAVGLVLIRCAPLSFFDAVFDSDQAIIGLMAKHLAEGRAVPVFTYGQDHLLGSQAWMAAPLFWAFGPSVVALKAPLVLVNVVTAVLLVWLLDRELTLRPLTALIVASPFLLAPPGTAIYFVEASGSQIEPFLVVMLLWLTRRRQLLFGAILGLGYLQRVFAAYAFGAYLLLELLDRSLLTRGGFIRTVKTGVGFTAVWYVVGTIRTHAGSAWGPATSGEYFGFPSPVSDAATLNIGLLLERFCFDIASLPRTIPAFLGPFLSTFMGGHREPLVFLSIPSDGTQGVDGLWVLLGATLLVALLRLVWLTARRPSVLWGPQARFGTYLLAVGGISTAAYLVSQCGRVGPTTMRYTLLTLLGIIGLVACHLAVETRPALRRLTVGVVTLWAVLTLGTHTRLLAEFVEAPPENNRQTLADYLVDNGIRYGYADFWDVYSTMFLADEQVILSSTSVSYVQQYEWIVQNHQDEAVWILREPCEGGRQATDVHWICPPRPGTW